jgi:hypothetical protein
MTLTTNQLHYFWTLTPLTLMVSNVISRAASFVSSLPSDPKDPLDKAQLKDLLYEEVVSFVPSI